MCNHRLKPLLKNNFFLRLLLQLWSGTTPWCPWGTGREDKQAPAATSRLLMTKMEALQTAELQQQILFLSYGCPWLANGKHQHQLQLPREQRGKMFEKSSGALNEAEFTVNDVKRGLSSIKLALHLKRQKLKKLCVCTDHAHTSNTRIYTFILTPAYYLH